MLRRAVVGRSAVGCANPCRSRTAVPRRFELDVPAPARRQWLSRPIGGGNPTPIIRWSITQYPVASQFLDSDWILGNHIIEKVVVTESADFPVFYKGPRWASCNFSAVFSQAFIYIGTFEIQLFVCVDVSVGQFVIFNFRQPITLQVIRYITTRGECVVFQHTLSGKKHPIKVNYDGWRTNTFFSIS